jgi:hypothetical protein
MVDIALLHGIVHFIAQRPVVVYDRNGMITKALSMVVMAIWSLPKTVDA